MNAEARNPAAPASANGAEQILVRVDINTGGMTPQEFADYHRVSLSTVWRWLRAGRLVTRKSPGGRIFFLGVRP